MPFYDLSESERIALTERAITERRTLIEERWRPMDSREATEWASRSALAAELLANCESVADLGCGTMVLRRHLRPETRYVGIDAVARDARTIVVDLNRDTLPKIDVQGWAVLGLLEYLFDVPALLLQLYGVVAVSYNAADRSNVNRRAHAWVNDYDTPSLEQAFNDAGFQIERRVALDTQQVWRLLK